MFESCQRVACRVVMTAFDGTDALAGVAAEARARLDAVLVALAGR